MRLNLSKNLRKVMFFVLTILFLLFSYLIYNELYNTEIIDQKIPIYSYSNKGSINYIVYLKPNNLYDNNKLEEGKLYITEFVDYIEANLKYEFIGEREANVKAEYSIIAKVQGFNSEGDKLLNIWEKDFLVIPRKIISSYKNKISIDEKVKLNLNEYTTYVEDIMKTSKINCQTKLTLFMNVNLTGSTEKGTIEDSISTSIIIPLGVTIFEITGNNIVDEPGAIEETVQVKLPVNKSLVVIFGLILAASLISLIVLIFFIKIAPDKDQHEKELNKIFKKHRDRLVALRSNVDLTNSIIVKSIDDLVKIADEVGKPILYKYSDNYKEINKFYVTNNDEFFLLVLEYSDIVEHYEDTEIKIVEGTSEQIKTESQLN